MKINNVVIGGKSMGGRIASHLAARESEGVSGLLVLGYPLLPAKVSATALSRTEHLPKVTVRSLFVQGDRDSFGCGDRLAPHLPPSANLVQIRGADHDFNVRKSDGREASAVTNEIDSAVIQFCMTTD